MAHSTDVQRALDILTDQQNTGSVIIDTLDARIAAAQEQLGAARIVKGSTDLEVPEEMRATVNEIVALVSDEQRLVKQHEAAVERGKKFLAAIIEKAEDGNGATYEQLTVNGAPVFGYKPSVVRILDQAAVKAEFPDTPENKRFYTDSLRRNRTLR